MSQKISNRFLLLYTSAFILSACTKGDSDLLVWLNEVKNRPAPALDPLPVIEEQQQVVYSKDGLRDPFSSPPPNRYSARSGPQPDINRRRQSLEAFSLDALSMVGTIGTGASTTGLILAPDKITYRVTPGSYIGQSDGRVISVVSNEIALIELIPDGNGGWIERQARLALNESKSGDKK